MAKSSLVIVGTGWAGYTLSHKLDEKKYDITVISPEETSPYTPLLVGSESDARKEPTDEITGKRSMWSIRLLPS
jgi:NADH dehydrogenase FAD-containing subunit